MSSSPHRVSPTGSPILGSPATPMTESGRFSPYVQMSAAEPIATAATCTPISGGGPEMILYESYLHKTPPLKSLVMVSHLCTMFSRVDSTPQCSIHSASSRPQL